MKLSVNISSQLVIRLTLTIKHQKHPASLSLTLFFIPIFYSIWREPRTKCVPKRITFERTREPNVGSCLCYLFDSVESGRKLVPFWIWIEYKRITAYNNTTSKLIIVLYTNLSASSGLCGCCWLLMLLFNGRTNEDPSVKKK